MAIEKFVNEALDKVHTESVAFFGRKAEKPKIKLLQEGPLISLIRRVLCLEESEGSYDPRTKTIELYLDKFERYSSRKLTAIYNRIAHENLHHLSLLNGLDEKNSLCRKVWLYEGITEILKEKLLRRMDIENIVAYKDGSTYTAYLIEKIIGEESILNAYFENSPRQIETMLDKIEDNFFKRLTKSPPWVAYKIVLEKMKEINNTIYLSSLAKEADYVEK